MSTEINVKNAERKAWRSVFQDGLWDIYLGILLLAMGIGDLLDEFTLSKVAYYAIYFSVIAVGILVLWAGKRFITIPRLGRVKFGQKGKSRQQKTQLLLFVSVAIGFIAWFVADRVYNGGIAKSLNWDLIFPLVYVLNVLMVFGLGAYILDYPRLYIVAVLYALPIPLKMVLDQTLSNRVGYITFVIPALIIVGMGLYCLIRFIQEHPMIGTMEME